MVRNPSYFFDASPERALIDPDNLHILIDHIKCACFELPFTGSEAFGRHDLQEVLSVLAEQGLVHRTGLDAGPSGQDSDGSQEAVRWTWTSESYPANAVSLRSVSSDNFVVVDVTGKPRVIGEADFTSGPSTLHPKAIYIVEGTQFQVETLDFEGRKAYVRKIDCDYYTDAISYTRVTILDTFESDAGASECQSMAPRAHGEVHVVSRVVGFKKIKFYTNENVGSGELDLPEQQMHTTAYWLTVPSPVMAQLPYASDDRRDGVLGLAFALKQVAQLLLMCDGHDIGLSIDTGEQVDPGIPADGSPRVFVYDSYPGGIGFSRPLYRMHDELLGSTYRLIAECQCENGCPACVGPVGNTGPLAKSAALSILDLVRARSSSALSTA